jgi:hypothetical protein
MTITVQAINDKGAVIGAFDTNKAWKAQQKVEVWGCIPRVASINVVGSLGGIPLLPSVYGTFCRFWLVRRAVFPSLAPLYLQCGTLISLYAILARSTPKTSKTLKDNPRQ